MLEAWTQATTVPCVAIGGIKPDNCAPLVRGGGLPGRRPSRAGHPRSRRRLTRRRGRTPPRHPE
ncbi:MAG: hypothetical protein AB7P02_06895 [Alphaproteobacteria bacterium]